MPARWPVPCSEALRTSSPRHPASTQKILCPRMAEDCSGGRCEVRRNLRKGQDSLQPARSITTRDQERYECCCPEPSHQDVGHLRHRYGHRSTSPLLHLHSIRRNPGRKQMLPQTPHTHFSAWLHPGRTPCATRPNSETIESTTPPTQTPHRRDLEKMGTQCCMSSRTTLYCSSNLKGRCKVAYITARIFRHSFSCCSCFDYTCPFSPWNITRSNPRKSESSHHITQVVLVLVQYPKQHTLARPGEHLLWSNVPTSLSFKLVTL